MDFCNCLILVLSIAVSVMRADTIYTKYDPNDYSNSYGQRSRSDNDLKNQPGTSESRNQGQCGCMAGQPGAPGIPGNHGAPGIPGNPGKDGFRGERGSKGEPGSIGLIGEPGMMGPIGPQGVRGKRGNDGHTGEKGEQGEKGEPGAEGPIGPRGLRGLPGETVKTSSHIAFSVIRNTKLGPVLQDTPVTFERVITNVGGSFNEYSSHFISPTNGTFVFLTHILGQKDKDVVAWIMLNNKHKVPLHGDHRAGYGMGSQSIILSLKLDDHVWIQLSKDSGLLNDYSTFSGFLLFEDTTVTNSIPIF